MNKGLIGKKLGMTQIFAEDGRRIPVTVVEAGPCVVLQKKTIVKDGYNAIQIGFGQKEAAKSVRPLVGHCKAAGQGVFGHLRELRLSDVDQYNVGDQINADIFAPGDIIDVTGTSIGKGFQGVVKRHGFGGVGQSTHGQHNRLRAPGSVGASSFPSRVFKGMRMAGQTGNARVTVQNLQVLKVIAEHNLLLVKGSVPGCKGSIVLIEK